MDLRHYLHVARTRWKLVTGTILAALTLATALTALDTPTYSSSARLFISTAQAGGSTQAYEGSLLSAARVDSYAGLVTSHAVSNAVVGKLGLPISPAELASKVTTSIAPKTVLLQISVTDTNPREAQRLTQTIAEQLTTLVSQLETPPGRSRAPIKATIVDPASLPTRPTSPQPLRNLSIAAVLGLLLGFGASVVRESLDVTVKDAEDVAEAAEVPVMGSIAYDPTAEKHPLLTALDNHAPRVESFRVLRTNMQFVDVGNDRRVFTVTSSVPDEGKTSTATNLAIVLAQAGQSVLLLEGDLRRPCIHLSPQFEETVGLTTVLIGRAPLAEAVQRSGVPGLSVLTSGALPPNPSELLQSPAMSDLLAQARLAYDIVIIDAPPLLPTTDAALLAAQSDGALLVVRHGKTTKDELRQAASRLESVGGRPLGAVLNMVPPGQSSGGYVGYADSYRPIQLPADAGTPVWTPQL